MQVYDSMYTYIEYTMTKKKLRTVGYIRVSTSEQAEKGISLANQKQKIKAYAEVKDLDLIGIISDKGISGKNLNRPGINEIINLINKGKIDAVVVYKLDRLTRNTKDLLYLFDDLFTKKDVMFYSLNENIDTSTAMGKFFLTLMGAMGQMERDLIGERTKDVLAKLKKDGRRLGCPDKPPLGFMLNKRIKAEMVNLVEVPEDIIKVKTIFRMRTEKQSLSNIGKQVNMGKSSVKYVLDNDFYTKRGIASL